MTEVTDILVVYNMAEKDENIDIVEEELWDHYSELPNPAWYEYISKRERELCHKCNKRLIKEKERCFCETEHN